MNTFNLNVSWHCRLSTAALQAAQHIFTRVQSEKWPGWMTHHTGMWLPVIFTSCISSFFDPIPTLQHNITVFFFCLPMWKYILKCINRWTNKTRCSVILAGGRRVPWDATGSPHVSPSTVPDSSLCFLCKIKNISCEKRCTSRHYCLHRNSQFRVYDDRYGCHMYTFFINEPNVWDIHPSIPNCFLQYHVSVGWITCFSFWNITYLVGILHITSQTN